ncbi:flagellar hook-basal body complex protein [Tropicimonas isoalkanivorans]|uniref:Flagellar basal-body rod protein FlgF n=1 Tax=Tropicimonas isoalkanivorans TaxID=441112 RepID=A0A1I1PJL7_9RHOB|nr:flagellar hook-basal body complex protein [Tropicimonas isoalkanivorans]SFD10015.1 flagellar basal-body rod protein FlgF [Tropicimonas isoalkanivorans]
MSVGYVTLSRQTGLMREMQTIANNIANLSTTGFRREGVVFSEHIAATPGPGGSVSMAAARARHVDLSQGAVEPTGGALDLAIQGEGFFQVQTPQGMRLTRAGAFMPNEAGDLVTPEGHLVLDEGGAPVFVPPDSGSVAVAADGTLSADGRPLGRIGLFRPADPADLQYQSGSLLQVSGELEPVDDSTVRQGFLEAANVNPVREITRMIEVQRAYELGQSFSERESDRVSKVIETLTR